MNFTNLHSLANAAKVLILLAMIGAIFAITRSSLIARPPITYAVIVDLTFSLPFVYWLFIRKTSISRMTLIPFFVFGLFFARIVLPAGNSLLEALKMIILPLLEIGVLNYAACIIFKSWNSFKSLKSGSYDALESLRQILAVNFPSAVLGKAVAFEIGVFYYALFKWRGKARENSFTYYRDSGALMLLAVFIFLLLSETVVLHVLLAGWSRVAAWLVTALSAYCVLQLFAHFKAILFRPVELEENRISIRCGIIGDAKIGYDIIASVKIVSQPHNREKGALYLCAAGAQFTAPNVKITLREAATLNSFYAVQKSFKTIFLAIDDAGKFQTAIEKRLNTLQQAG